MLNTKKWPGITGIMFCHQTSGPITGWAKSGSGSYGNYQLVAIAVLDNKPI